MGHKPTLYGSSDDLFIDAPHDWEFTPEEDEAGNTLIAYLIDQSGTETKIGETSGGGAGVAVGINDIEPDEDLGLTEPGYYTLRWARKDGSNEDTLWEGRVYLQEVTNP